MLKKRIPTILGIFLLLVGIAAGVYLVELGPQSFTTRANPELQPTGVRVSNTSDRSFTVSWRTEAASLGFVRYGENRSSLTLSALDSRDDEGSSERSFTNHYVDVTGLTPQKTYYFEIISGSDSSVFNDEGSPFLVTTGAALPPSALSDTSYGSLYYPDLSPAEGTIIYLSLSSGTELSSLTGASGTWAVPLSTMRSDDLSSYLEYDRSGAELRILALGPDGSQASAITTTGNDSPVNDLVLGESYDFTISPVVDGSPTTQESQFSLEDFDVDVSTLPLENAVTVENISEGESVNTQQPAFVGEAPPGATLEIVLESNQPISDTVVVGNSGEWSWSPSTSLEPGPHTITLRWLDVNGISRVFTRNFVVFAQGESSLPSFEATPSASPTPVELAQGPSPTPPPVSQPTLTPTAAPTPVPTAVPTLAPSPRVTPSTSSPSSSATDPSLPVPGTGFFSIGVVIFGILLSVIGSSVLFLKRST